MTLQDRRPAPRCTPLAFATSARPRSRHPIGNRSTRVARICTVLGSLVASIVIFYPHSIAAIAPPRLLLVVILATWAIAIGLVMRSALTFVTMLTAIAAYALVIGLDQLAGSNLTEMGLANAQRYLVLIPFAALVGYTSRRIRAEALIARGFVIVALSAAALATIEFFSGASLFGRNFSYFVEYGRPRSLVAADHPLVLGLLFVVALSLAGTLTGWKRSASVLALAWATWTTGSEGPIALAIPLLAVALIPAFATFVAHNATYLQIAAAVVIATGLYFSYMIWAPVAVGATSGEYSRAYRAAMYSLLPDMLQEHPFGYGLNGLPNGSWLISTEYKGVRDISVTIDSEFVFLAAIAGVPGILALLGAAWVALRTLRQTTEFSMALLAVCTVGAVLAVTVWDSLATLIGLLFGVCLAAARKSPWQARSRSAAQ